jgi:predicted ATPase
MGAPLDKLSISGFKSIQDLQDFELKNINILIGSNGSGKSNFIDFFRLLREFINGNLLSYVKKSGGISDIMFNGRKSTQQIEFQTRFGPRGFRFSLEPDAGDSCIVKEEDRFYAGGRSGWWQLGGNTEGFSRLAREAQDLNDPDRKYSLPVYQAIASWVVYHFHDSSAQSAMRHSEIIQDNKGLRYNASNIAPFLLRLRNEDDKSYQSMRQAIRLAMPFFDDFLLTEESFGEKQKVNLSWTQKGSDYPMQPYHLSDGSIRLICLAAALLQPNPPATIIIDEPELGLHPAAISLLAEMIRDAAKRTQIIIATQSPALLDHFTVEDIIIIKRHDGASTFERLAEKDFTSWLEEYSVGELWTKNVIQGGVSHE